MNRPADKESDIAERQGGGVGLGFLMATALICGAAIMVLEILGSRVIGPFFGVSLFVWTSLITVTMIALAAGYWAGGIAADRREGPVPLYAAILLAGLLTLAIPALRVPVLKLCAPMGVRSGAFLSALLLFGPSLFLLGCVSPLVVRLALHRMDAVGRTVGGLYGVSTLGSILGTVLAGFVLIAYLRVSQVFFVVGGVLIALSAVYWGLYRRRAGFLLFLALPVLCLAAGSGSAGATSQLPNGTRATLVESREGYYGNVRVVDYAFGAARTREMMIDGLIQGGVDLSSGLPIYEYLYFMEFLPVAVRPGGQRCLVLGLGAGLVPRWYESRGIPADVVDIDPNVVEIARKHFGFQGRGELFLEDARSFLSRPGAAYDYLVMDVYNGDSIPTHLLSLEAFGLAKGRMTPAGVLALNLHGTVDGRSLLTNSVVLTLKQLFANVDIYPTYDPKAADHGNIALIAYDGAPARVTAEALQGMAVHPVAREGVLPFAERKSVLPAGAGGVIFTDEHNPADIYDGWLREKTRLQILDDTDWDILTG
jgi:spermidine synthase